MSNPILTTTNSKLDTRVKEPSGVVPPTSGPGSPDHLKLLKKFSTRCMFTIMFRLSTEFLRTKKINTFWLNAFQVKY